MKSLAAITCLVLAAALAAGCAPYRVVSVTPSIQTCEAQGITDGDTFVQKKVFFLSPSFDPQAPDTNNPQYKTPSGTNAYNYQPYSNDTAAAYNAAPIFFKEQLCGLDGVFIVQNACATNPCTPLDVANYSWGFREHPPQISSGVTPGKYVAISQQLWQGGQAPAYSYYETKRLQQILNWTPANPPSFSANPDTPLMSVLAALAHEFWIMYMISITFPEEAWIFPDIPVRQGKTLNLMLRNAG